MALADIAEPYFTYEARLASFHKSSKKRGSTASGRGAKALNWPHKTIAPAKLARAGLFYHPSPSSPDNVVCFLCHKAFDGWEAGDDPLVEHLTHAPECGWALTAAVEAELEDYATEDPDAPLMKEARKATFAGRWPHEGKKGWKCKTKQLVDAGWRYTPTEDYDDMATCTYCSLALDGWEPSDKPLDEHYNRSPDCAFFVLLNEYKASKKSNRAKISRASKASRLSTQSVATAASELPSIADLTVGTEDSVLTTITPTTTETAKRGKAKKATSSKSRKTKAKKEELIEDDQADELGEVEEAAPHPKPKRGKKRDSTTMEDPMDTTSEAPAPKKRAARTRASAAVTNSTLETDDTEMQEAPKKAAGRKKATRTKTTRKASTTSVASTGSANGLPGTFPEDDEIERQLEEDLQRPLSENEDSAAEFESDMMTSRAEIHEVSAVATKKPAKTQQSPEFDMLDPSPMDMDDAEVEDELKALQAEMEMDGPVLVPEWIPEPEEEVQPEPQPKIQPQPEPELHIPKKGRKAGTRKASKQTKSKTTKVAPPPVVEKEIVPPEPETEPVVEAPEAEIEEPTHNESLASTGTVVIKKASGSGTRSRGRPSKVSLIMSQEPSEIMELVEPLAEAPTETLPEPANPATNRGRGRPSKASMASRASAATEDVTSAEAPTKRGRGRSKKSVETQQPAESDAPQTTLQQDIQDVHVYSAEALEVPEEHVPATPSQKPPHSSPMKAITSPRAPPSITSLANPPSTPGRIISPAPSARQAAISPSQSPQSSNAENEPPSSKPAAGTTKRVVLAPVATTPMRGSPSKRNIVAGLRSTTPWTALDLDTVFDNQSSSPNKENGVERFLSKGQNITSPEKQMTVEEWVLFNAAEAEKKLKHECEAMVSKFESEGTKAMRVLEGLIVD